MLFKLILPKGPQPERTNPIADRRAVMVTLRGHFLIATPAIDRGFFNRSLTYLCRHDENGAMGIVVNQRLDITFDEMLQHLEIPTDPEIPDYPILAGGPIRKDHGFVLHSSAGDWQGGQAVHHDISLTTSRDILWALAKGEGPQECLVALGYAGWAAGQLEAEIADNSWLTVAADRQTLFHAATSKKLAEAGRMLGIDVDLLTADAGHA
jgi:putative transcriptional regulator